MSRFVYQLSGDDLKVSFVVKERAKVEGRDEKDILKELGISKAWTPKQRWPKKKVEKAQTAKDASSSSSSSKRKSKKKPSSRKSSTSNTSVYSTLNQYLVTYVRINQLQIESDVSSPRRVQM